MASKTAERPQSRASNLGRLLSIAAVSLIAGYVVLVLLESAVVLMWESVPESLDPSWRWVYAIGVPALAGALVFLARRAGDHGHNPLGGLTIAPLTAKQYPMVIAAIAATLIGGLVLGPEVALVSTGAVIGTVLSARWPRVDPKRALLAGVGGAVLALVVGPGLNGSLSVDWGYTFAFEGLVGGAVTAGVTACALWLGRMVAIGFIHVRGGDRPQFAVLVGVGAAIGGIAAAYSAIAGEPLNLVLTSGEGQIRELVVLDAWGLIAVTVGLKLLVYALSEGAGFRGGPYFPAIFIGAGIGAVLVLVAPEWFAGAAAAGIVASVVYLARPNWRATVVLGIVLGFIAGGWQVIPLAVVAAVVARLVPSPAFAEAPVESVPSST